MKTNKMISRIFTTLLVIVFAMATTQSFAQVKKAAVLEKMKDCKIDKKDCKMDKKDCKMDMKECGKYKKAGCCATKAKGTTKTKAKNTAKATYVCPMHSDVISYKPGVCLKCKMDLEKK